MAVYSHLPWDMGLFQPGALNAGLDFAGPTGQPHQDPVQRPLAPPKLTQHHHLSVTSSTIQ